MARLELEFSREASAEFDNSTAFGIQRFGEDVALGYARGPRTACELLCDFPHMARSTAPSGPKSASLCTAATASSNASSPNAC